MLTYTSYAVLYASISTSFSFALPLIALEEGFTDEEVPSPLSEASNPRALAVLITCTAVLTTCTVVPTTCLRQESQQHAAPPS